MATEYDYIDIIGRTHETYRHKTDQIMNKYYHKQETSSVRKLLNELLPNSRNIVIDLGTSVGVWLNDYKRFGFKKVVSDKSMEFELDAVDSYLEAMPKGVNELCCHPGYLSEDPLDEPEFRVVRPRELEFFTDPRLRSALDEANIGLISYRDF